MKIDIVPDASVYNPSDFWGIGIAQDSCPARLQEQPRRNPYYQEGYGFDLSQNSKTILAVSQWFDSCRPSAWCAENCYGAGTRFRCGPTPEFLIRNYQLFEAIGAGEIPDRVIRDLAEEIVKTCHRHGVDNLRWGGVGDLTPGFRILAEAVADTDRNFTVWGFTRKPEELIQMEPRNNLVFWCSTDYTMRTRLDEAIEAVTLHGTGLSYSCDVGEWRLASDYERSAVKPAVTETRRGKAYAFRRLLQTVEVPWHVAHGFHGGTARSPKGLRAGQQIVTHLGLPQECPGTDPLTTGNPPDAICQACRWCMSKKPKHKTLLQHRRVLGWSR